MSDHKPWTEEIKVSAENLVNEIERLVKEGNVTHIVIKNEEGHTFAEFPVNIGLIGILVAPILAAVAAIVVYAVNFTIVVTRHEPPPVL